MEKYYLPISQETLNLLQRLNFEVITAQGVVTRLIENAKDNPDASVLDSPAFVHYHKNLEEAEFQYSLAKDHLSKELEPIVKKQFGFDNAGWQIVDWSECKVEIMPMITTNSKSCNCNKTEE